MTLSISFPDTFENLPDDIQSHIDDWKEVRLSWSVAIGCNRPRQRPLLNLLLSIRSVLLYSDRFYKVIIVNEMNINTMSYERMREISVLNLCKFLSPITLKNATGMPEF
jgi:hypothetical protein